MDYPYEKPKYQDGRRNNGGARAGAGRPVNNKFRLMIDEHLLSEVIVPEKRSGQIRYVKKTVLKAMLDTLFQRGMRGDLRSIKAYLDLTLGKPITPSDKKPRYSAKSVIKALAMSGRIR